MGHLRESKPRTLQLVVCVLAVCLIGQILAGSVAMAANDAADRERAQMPPNIVLMLADDMTWWDCEPYGSSQVATPNLTRLAEDGCCMDFAFTSTAMCAPTRQQLYTGMWPVRNGAYPNHSRVHDGVRSFVDHFQSLGYRVGLSGKSHCKPRVSYQWENVGPNEVDFDAIEEFVTRDASQPFFLVVASDEPHKPWTQGDASAYPPGSIEVPPNLVDTLATREELSKYFAEITFLDAQVGRVDEILKQSDVMEDTLFVFTSEQGCQLPFGGKWSCYEAGLRTAMIFRWPGRIDAGSRSSAMVQYVDVLPTLLEAAGVDPSDFETGIEGGPNGGQEFDGFSFLGSLMRRTTEHRDAVFGVHTTRGIINGSECYPVRSVRDSRFKYIRNLNHEEPFQNLLTREEDDFVLQSWAQLGGAAQARSEFYQMRPLEELYDLESDPYELNNLAENPDYEEVKRELRARLHEWMTQQGDLGKETELIANSRQGRRGN